MKTNLLAFIISFVVPLIVIYCLYSRTASFIERNRIYKTVLTTILASLALDFISLILFGINIWAAYQIIMIKIYMLMIAVPFFYWATDKWNHIEPTFDNNSQFWITQGFGLILGFVIGYLIVNSPQWHHFTDIPGIYTSVTGLFFFLIH